MLLTFVKMNVIQKKIITFWLFSGLFLILSMIVIGGITRITESGLSMAHWSFSGEMPTEENILKSYLEWKETPQGKSLISMSLEEFKKIYFWEYLHRTIGRFLGILFIIPFTIFSIKKWISRNDFKKYIILLIIGALQSIIGWWMVKSGLTDKPNVSHFRLTIHFIAALILASYIWWLILEINYDKLGYQIINRLSKWFLLILIVQLIYGAFTAGLRAGYLIDPESSLNTIFGYFHTEEMRNKDFLNNPYNIQFLHRSLAWILCLFSFYIWKKTRATKLHNAGNLFVFIIISQIILGISTILIRVEKHLAIMHQFIASILLLIIIYLIYRSQTIEKS